MNRLWPSCIRRAILAYSALALACQGTTPKPAETPYPPALLEFMAHDWAPRNAPPASPIDAAARCRERRQALSAAFRGQVLVIPSGHPKVRNGDVRYPFRAGSDFYYLTGSQDPDSVLIMQPVGTGHRSVLYVAPAYGREDSRFFTDYQHGDLWTGGAMGPQAAQARYGVDVTASLEELPQVLQRLRAGDTPPYTLRGFDGTVDAGLLPEPAGDAALAEHLATLRLLKDADELQALHDACAITASGFAAVLAALPTARIERDLAQVFSWHAQRLGSGTGYDPVVAAGKHATILHWTVGDGALRPGDLLLLDLGAEGGALYTADVTRTVPQNGHFSPPQRQVYEAVLAAHGAALAAVKPGNPVRAPHDAAMASLVDSLIAMGIMHPPASEILDRAHQLHRRYTLHGVSHPLGLDVHDCGRAPATVVRDGSLQPNMVLTIEPGLYFQGDDLTVPEQLRGIGVRIEDDVRVTQDGYELLSDLPRRPDAVEAWVQDHATAAANRAASSPSRAKKPAEPPGG